jgi:hypothetical protein
MTSIAGGAAPSDCWNSAWRWSNSTSPAKKVLSVGSMAAARRDASSASSEKPQKRTFPAHCSSWLLRNQTLNI